MTDIGTLSSPGALLSFPIIQQNEVPKILLYLKKSFFPKTVTGRLNTRHNR